MRRKDWRYYIKTAALKLQARRFRMIRAKSGYASTIKNVRLDLAEKLNEVQLRFTDFEPFFHSYFYFKDSSIFQNSYLFDDDIPTRLVGEKGPNPLLPLYYFLVEWNTKLLSGEDKTALVEKVAKICDIHSISDKRGRLYPYTDDYELFGLKAPWLAGITQALACSVYLRMFRLSENVSYLERAKLSFLPLTVAVEKGGLLQSTRAGLEWVEEYPSSPSSYVLNGHMFAIIAAIEMFQCSQEDQYATHATQWIKALIHHLPEYQFEDKLLHNKYQDKLSNIEYQGLYVGLFKHLHRLTAHPIFKELYSYYDSKMDWSSFYRFYDIELRS